MASINMLNPKAEVARASQAMALNISAARGLQDVLSSNLGPKGTMKMLVSGAGDIKITKDGCTLLGEMQIQHPTAGLIARVATSQDEITGDGTTSIVLLVGEIMRQAGLLAADGVHPRMLTEGIEIAKNVAIKELEKIKFGESTVDRDILIQVARSTLATKLQPDVAELLTTIIVDAVLSIVPSEDKSEDIDLFMVEIMEMVHQLDLDTKLVKGLVLDHGGRHPDMPTHLEDCYILTCNVSFEYDKSEINSGFFYNSTQDREKMVKAERQFTDNKVMKVIELKRKVCTAENNKKFVVINQKGIDPISLELLAKEGILALRRAKRRNMERLVKCCGGEAMNSVEELTEECLGHAGKVYQMKLNDDNFTFVEETPQSQSVSILIKGPNKHTVVQIKDAVRDGLRAVKNTIDLANNGLHNLLPGAGAVEVFLHYKLLEYKQNTPMLKQQYGVQAFADALLIIPRTLAKNAGLDQQDILANLQNQYIKTKIPVGVNLQDGQAIDPKSLGIYDNFETKKHMIASCASIAGNLMLVDEVMRAGLSSLKEKSG